MNPIQLGWIDYSLEHRNKVMTVLHALTAPGAVDELGIGQIRDGFANQLFPGTSTIQTRAKYFFIVPYLLMELERKRYLTPKSFLQKLSDMELDLIETLKKNGETGVIGETAGRGLKRKPSSIYWNGLRTFGMFRYPHLSLDDYVRATCAANKEMTEQKAMGKRTDDDQAQDDPDAYQGPVPGGFWRCPLPPEDWKEKISIHLSTEEAAYLKDRINKSPKTKDSLLTYLANQDLETIQKTQHFEALGEVFDLPDSIRKVYDMAVRFSDFIYGATLRYNVILSERENKKVLQEWDFWCQSPFAAQSFADYEPTEALDYLKISNYPLRRFLKRWHQTYLSGNINAVDELIVSRETEIKSRKRAKLKNPSLYAYREGQGMLGSKLEYRYRNAKDILIDIYKGWEETHAETVK